VELVVAIGILTAFVVSIAVSYSLLLRLAFANVSNIKATLLAEETIEVVRYLKTVNWDANIDPLNTDQDYFIRFVNATNWEITGEYNLVDGIFERKFVLEEIRRNSSGVIVDSGGSLDPDTNKITVYVSWPKDNGATTTKTMATYISKLK